MKRVGASDNNTDKSKSVASDTVYVRPNGGATDEAFPKPNVEYDFCVNVTNGGHPPSEPFSIQFTLSGDQGLQKDLDFAQDADLDAGTSAKAVVRFRTLPNKFAIHHLQKCIYSDSVPEKPINCAGSFDFTINTESTDDSSASASSDTTSGGDSASGSGDPPPRNEQ